MFLLFTEEKGHSPSSNRGTRGNHCRLRTSDSRLGAQHRGCFFYTRKEGGRIANLLSNLGVIQMTLQAKASLTLPIYARNDIVRTMACYTRGVRIFQSRERRRARTRRTGSAPRHDICRKRRRR